MNDETFWNIKLLKIVKFETKTIVKFNISVKYST